MLISHLRLNLLSELCRSGFPVYSLYAFLVSLTCVACPANIILCDLIAVIVFGEGWTYRSMELVSVVVGNVILTKQGTEPSKSCALLRFCHFRYHYSNDDDNGNNKIRDRMSK
jgi:hypothetical protein